MNRTEGDTNLDKEAGKAERGLCPRRDACSERYHADDSHEFVREGLIWVRSTREVVSMRDSLTLVPKAKAAIKMATGAKASKESQCTASFVLTRRTEDLPEGVSTC